MTYPSTDVFQHPVYLFRVSGVRKCCYPWNGYRPSLVRNRVSKSTYYFSQQVLLDCIYWLFCSLACEYTFWQRLRAKYADDSSFNILHLSLYRRRGLARSWVAFCYMSHYWAF